MQVKEFEKNYSKGLTSDVKKTSFDSIEEFFTYITTKPTNKLFVGKERSKDETKGCENFYGTKSFDEATSLLKNGWDVGAMSLEQKLKAQKQLAPSVKPKQMFDVVGYQASVPRYLQGVPTSMVNKKMVPCKQKVVSIVKSISYPAITERSNIIEQSMIVLGVVSKLESQGVRVNLFVEIGSHLRDKSSAKAFVYRVKVKSASERINVSKLAFPMVHPSMLRRFMVRCLEVENGIDKRYVRAYGHVMPSEMMKATGEDGECFVPAFVSQEKIDGIKSTSEMIEYLKNLK